MNNSKKSPIFFFKISAKVALLKYLVFIFRNLFFYIIITSFIADNAFMPMIFISSFLISVFIIFLNKKQILKLYNLAIKKEFFMLSINENELSWYNQIHQQSSKIALSEIQNFYTEDDTLFIKTRRKEITIDLPIGSGIKNLQTTLTKLGVPSIFRYTKDSKYPITEELISKAKFYFKKSVISMVFRYISQILMLSFFIFGMYSLLTNPFFAKGSAIAFLIPYFGIFLILIISLISLFQLLHGGIWEVAIIDSKLIWNTPYKIKGSFVVNLSAISAVTCNEHIDSETNESHYYYSIKTTRGQEIILDDSLGVDLAHLVSRLKVSVKYIRD